MHVIFTELPATEPGSYLTDLPTANVVVASTVQTLNTNGIQLTATFLNGIKDDGKGVVLLEAKESTSLPLQLRILDATNGVVLIKDLPLQISGVEEMFRHKNYRAEIGGTETVAERTGSPTNYPDTLCINKYFLFVHGFITDEQESRGSQAEVFKRLFWSGSKAKFVGITWYGNEPGGGGYLPANLCYHLNVHNAFLTASNVASYINSLSGEITAAGHSLGNIVLSSAIGDHGANVDYYYMINAAVASEAYDSSMEDLTTMVHPDWDGYSNRLWATEWHGLFDAGDHRRELTWRDRFGGAIDAAYNFYSPGEEVLAVKDGYPSLLSWAELLDWSLIGNYAWWKQELLKGRMDMLPIGGSTYGGWGFNDEYRTTGSGVYDPSNDVFISASTPEESEDIPDYLLPNQPFFDPGAIDDLYDPVLGSDFAQTNRNQLLAEMIPALSDPAGLVEIESLPVDRNLDMQNSFETEWPRGSSNPEWLHSDFKDIAYPYIHLLYDKFIELGGMSSE